MESTKENQEKVTKKSVTTIVLCDKKHFWHLKLSYYYLEKALLNDAYHLKNDIFALLICRNKK